MRVPRLLEPGQSDSPLVVVRSGFWNFNSFGFYDGDEALLIDPGFYPEDIALLGAAVTTRHREGAPRRVRHVVITHSHHDHIRGWASFPEAQVTSPLVVAQKGATAQSRILAAKRKIDERLGIADEGFEYPRPDVTFEAECTLHVGSREVVLFPLFGHSNCCSVVWIPSLRTLFTADYLVDPGLPYCRWEAGAMESALDWLADFCRTQGVETIWPAHNHPVRGSAAIQTAIHRDRESMRRIRTQCELGLQQARPEAEILECATAAALDWRGTENKATRLQDLDNARRVLLECKAQTAPE